VDNAHGKQRAVSALRRATFAVLCSAAIVAAAGILTSGCTSGDETKSGPPPGAALRAPDGRTLVPVALPDLSKMTESVQRQVLASHSALLKKSASGTPPEQLADAYGELGRLLMAANYPDAAEACFRDAEMLAANDRRWPYYLGHLYRNRGDLSSALTSFQRALLLQPDDVATLVWLGDLHLAQGQPKEAEAEFAKALALQPRSLSARFGLGRTAIAREDYRRAVTTLEEVLSQDPEAAAVHYPLATAYSALGDQKKADLHLKQREDHKILPADPLMVDLEELLESPQAYESRGIRALDQKDWTGAAALFRKGLALAPDSPALHHRLGTALFMMEDVSGAEAQFEEAVRKSPDHSLAQYSLGVLLQEKGRHADAIERFSAALRSRSNYHEARLRLATSLRRAGRAGESLPHYEEILTINAGHTEARFGQAMGMVQMGRYKDARDRLADAMRAFPDQAIFAHGLARLLAAAPDDGVRDGGQAIALVEELILKEQRTLELGETMAMALADLGRFEEATRVQRDLITGAERAGLQEVGRRLATNLRLYERREPCRTPWADGEMP
jgi:tetratricopeptide (TPR) repeat protein